MARWGITAYFLLVLGLFSWHLDTGWNANTVSRGAMVAALVEHGSLCIDDYQELTDDKALVDGHYYSEKAPLPALIVVPFWYVAVKTGIAEPGPHGALTNGLLRLGGFLCGSLPLALLVLILFKRIRGSHVPWPSGWLALLPFLGSFLLVYSGSFHGHLLAALMLVLAWLMRTREAHVLSGFLASAAVLSEYSLFVFPLAWMLQDVLTRKWRNLGAMMFGGLPGVLLLAFMNLLVTGSPLKLPYSAVAAHIDRSGGTLGLGGPSIGALYGLLFSGFRGLFTHAPATIICAIAAVMAMKRNGLRWTLMHPLVLPTIALVLMIAGHSMWWGGWAFGPRHLTSVAALLLIAGIPRLPDRPWADGALAWLCGWGAIVSLTAKVTTVYSLPTEVLHPFREMILPQFMHRSFTESQWPVQVGFSPIMGTFLFGLALILVLRLLRRIRSNDAPVLLP